MKHGKNGESARGCEHPGLRNYQQSFSIGDVRKRTGDQPEKKIRQIHGGLDQRYHQG
jgi:hypothetical protein